jgi:hypothetical protein
VEYARDHGARGLTADMMRANSRMMRVFKRGDHSLSVKTHAGVEELTMLSKGQGFVCARAAGDV